MFLQPQSSIFRKARGYDKGEQEQEPQDDHEEEEEMIIQAEHEIHPN